MASNTLEQFTIGGYTYQLRSQYCNKANCHKCPHGPYWYMKFTRRDGKRVLNYIGKDLPDGVKNPTKGG